MVLQRHSVHFETKHLTSYWLLYMIYSHIGDYKVTGTWWTSYQEGCKFDCPTCHCWLQVCQSCRQQLYIGFLRSLNILENSWNLMPPGLEKSLNIVQMAWRNSSMLLKQHKYFTLLWGETCHLSLTCEDAIFMKALSVSVRAWALYSLYSKRESWIHVRVNHYQNGTDFSGFFVCLYFHLYQFKYKWWHRLG